MSSIVLRVAICSTLLRCYWCISILISIVLDTNTYHDKLKTLIETGPYRLLNKEPTDRLSRKHTDKPLSLKRSGHLSETIYGLLKTNKPNTPLIPIVSCINIFAYGIPNQYPFPLDS